jgi:RimJ/RimL family protein N-acetyltransferase
MTLAMISVGLHYTAATMSSAPPRPEIPEVSRLELTIRTPRLVLRPPAATDVEGLWPYVSDPELPRMMSWSAHKVKDETVGWLKICSEARAGGSGVTWIIEHEGKVAGTIGLDGIRYQLRAWRVDRAELGYWLAPPLWGQGLVTEAATAVVRFGFETLGLHKVTVGCIEENVASRRVIEKLGFRWVGKLVDDVWRDGRWWTHLRWEMTADEWAGPRP